MKTFGLGSALIALSTTFWPMKSHAAYVTVRAVGIVDAVDGDDGFLPFGAIAGDPMSIEYVIDDVSPQDNAPSDPSIGFYYGSVLSLTVTVAGQSVVVRPPVPTLGLVQVGNNQPSAGALYDFWSVSAESAPRSSAPAYFANVDVFEYAPAPDMLTSAAYFVLGSIPSGASSTLSLAAATYSFGQLDRLDSIRATAHEISIVPLPAAGFLLSGGLLGMFVVYAGGTRQRKQPAREKDSD